MKSILIFTVVMVISLPSTAEHSNSRLFDCATLHSPFDPFFEQGATVFASIDFDLHSDKTSLIIRPSEGAIVIYEKRHNERAIIDLTGGSAYFTWSTSQARASASLVYLGGDWGLVIKQKHPERLTELEMYCSENSEIIEKLLAKGRR